MADEPSSFLIAGCGVSGRGAARLASYYQYNYSLIDENDSDDLRAFVRTLSFPPKSVCFGWKKGDTVPSADQVILSPGIRPKTPFREALEQAVPNVTGELEFALKRLPCPFVGITGTNGKTTVTELTTLILNAHGLHAEAAGNIGDSLSDAVIHAKEEKLDCVVVEISSFQLETMNPPHPAAAVLLNIASDHMDRYDSLNDYAAVKFKLLRGMTRGCLINHELRGLAKSYLDSDVPRLTFSTTRKTAFYSMRDGCFCRDGKELFPYSDMQLKGRHNAENILASLGLLEVICGVDALRDPAVIQALKSFKPAAHRLELFLEKDSIRYIDDSKATNPHAVNAALDAMPEGSQTVLILGGKDKDMDFTELLPHLNRIRLAVCTGAAAEKIARTISGTVRTKIKENFEDAVRLACDAAKKGNSVLLSPACASFDAFKSYAERGEVFQRLVREIVEGPAEKQ